MRLIGLAGKASAGKDTVCGFALEWCEQEAIEAERLAFADPLKVSAAACFGIPAHVALEFCNWLKQPGVFVSAERLEGEATLSARVTEGVSNLKGRRVTGRQFLQHYGTEAHRDVFDREFWVNVTAAKIADIENRGVEVVFLTDVRFPNEATFVNKRGGNGEIWEVTRSGLSDIESHASEVGLPEGAIEFQIHNDGSLDDLRDLTRRICESNLKEAL